MYSPSAGIIAVAAEVGLRCPRDLSVVACGNAPLMEAGVKWPGILVPEYDMGQAAVDMLLKRIASPEEHFPSISLPFKLVPGDLAPPSV
jgi:DNA-binding LacI/PurR family transcriptional regulator